MHTPRAFRLLAPAVLVPIAIAMSTTADGQIAIDWNAVNTALGREAVEQPAAFTARRSRDRISK